MYAKIKVINKKADEVAQRIPMLFGKESDEMKQICHFILRYYEPILSLLERQHLEDTMAGSIDLIYKEKLDKSIDEGEEKVKEEKAKQKEKLQQLSAPKSPVCSRRREKVVLPTKKELSQVVSILKNNKTRELLSAEEQLAFWANSQTSRVQDLKNDLETIKNEEKQTA